MATSTPRSQTVRRSGYAPGANDSVGRRGLHTRDRILACAAETFVANGFHGTSLDTIAKAAHASRATVYQYFAGKEDIFRELSAAAARDVIAHGERLGGLGPTADGVRTLHRWLAEWADIYDSHAAAFAEYPGIGTELSVGDVGPVAETFARTITARVHQAKLRGLHPEDAAAALMRIPHMVHLYRYRRMFPLPARDVLTRSLAVILQLMLFPDTPADVLRSVSPNEVDAAAPAPTLATRPVIEIAAAPLSPIAQDVLSVSSTLFAESGYYAVSMEQIAAGADVSRATLYRHFSTKDKILTELTRRAVIEIELLAATLSTMAPDGLTKWMLGYVRFHRAYRGVIRAWFDGTVAEQLSDAAVEPGLGAVHRAVTQLLATVEMPTGVDSQAAAAVVISVLGRMTEATAADGPASDAHAADLMVNLLRRSLLRTQPRGSV